MGFLSQIFANKFKQPNKEDWPKIVNKISRGLEIVRDLWFEQWISSLSSLNNGRTQNDNLQKDGLIYTKTFQLVCAFNFIGANQYIPPSDGKNFADSLLVSVVDDKGWLIVMGEYQKKLRGVDLVQQGHIFANDISAYITGSTNDIFAAPMILMTVPSFVGATHMVIADAFGDVKTVAKLESINGKMADFKHGKSKAPDNPKAPTPPTEASVTQPGNTRFETAIKVMCVANEYIFQKPLLDDGFEFISQRHEINGNKHYDILKYIKKHVGNDAERELYFDISAFYGKNEEIIPKYLDMPPANKPIDINTFLKLNDDFYAMCKAELGFDPRSYSLTFKQYSSEMVGGHIANLLPKDKTILVSPVKTYHEKNVPIFHGYFMMRMMIDHQVQHLLDSYNAIETETSLKSDYYKPVIGVECVQFTPLPGYSFSEDLINYTLWAHVPNAFDNKNEIRAFKASLQVAFQYNLFTSAEISSAIVGSNTDKKTAQLLQNAVDELQQVTEEVIKPSKSNDFVVPHDGSLQDAVEMVPPNGTIRILAGDHRIDQLVTIKKSLTIVGDCATSCIYSVSKDIFLSIEHCGDFTLKNLVIKGKGSIISVDCGNLLLEGNTFIKCYDNNMKHYDEQIKPKEDFKIDNKVNSETDSFLWDCCPDNSDGTSCLTIKGNTIGLISENIFIKNNNSLICRDNSSVNVIKNIINNSTSIGVQFTDLARGRFENNTVSNSEYPGVCISGQSSPVIVDNTIENNSGGISYSGESSGIAERNLCKGNKTPNGYEQSGISVGDKASPHLLRNICILNGLHGIKYSGNASGVAEENVCRENYIGISLYNSAEPKLIRNECIEATDVYGCGISYCHDSAGLAEGNICSGNDYAIKVDDNAHPDLINNNYEGSKIGVGRNDDELEYINSFYKNTNKYLRNVKTVPFGYNQSKTTSSKSLLRKYISDNKCAHNDNKSKNIVNTQIEKISLDPFTDTNINHDKKLSMAIGNKLRVQLINNISKLPVCIERQTDTKYLIDGKNNCVVGIAFSSESNNRWFLGLDDIKYEIIVLICYYKSSRVMNIILPYEFLFEYQQLLSRDKHNKLKFNVVQKLRETYLIVPHLGAIDITNYHNNYGAFDLYKHL